MLLETRAFHRYIYGYLGALCWLILSACSSNPSPLPPTPLPDDSLVLATLEQVNEARAQGGSCEDAIYPASSALRWDGRLADAAQAHSQDMAAQGYLEHINLDGHSPEERSEAQGYTWRRHGENLAQGHDSASSVVQGWLGSLSHCRTLRNADFEDTGIGVAKGSDGLLYWTQVFASPR